jgi:hypothetical protein
MSLEYPLEQICSHKSEPLQLAFARSAIPLLQTRSDRLFLARADGLVICGETEDAMESPVRTLREIYGDELNVGSLTIRNRSGPTLQEPHMGVRVSGAARYFDAIKADLLSRGAKVLDAECIGPLGIVRATAPLASLLGYPRSLATLTSGNASQVMWFSHYA